MAKSSNRVGKSNSNPQKIEILYGLRTTGLDDLIKNSRSKENSFRALSRIEPDIKVALERAKKRGDTESIKRLSKLYDRTLDALNPF